MQYPSPFPITCRVQEHKIKHAKQRRPSIWLLKGREVKLEGRHGGIGQRHNLNSTTQLSAAEWRQIEATPDVRR